MTPKRDITNQHGPAGHGPGPSRRQAFEKLVIAHQSRIRNYIRSLGVASSSVDDIAQEAILRAYKNFHDFEEGTSFPAWVNTIARHLIWNDRRKTQGRYKILNEKMTVFFDSNTPYDELADDEEDRLRRDALNQCMEEIPEKRRSLIHARYQERKEPAEIAKQAGMSAVVVRQRLLRLRQALRDCIDVKLNGVTGEG